MITVEIATKYIQHPKEMRVHQIIRNTTRPLENVWFSSGSQMNFQTNLSTASHKFVRKYLLVVCTYMYGTATAFLHCRRIASHVAEWNKIRKKLWFHFFFVRFRKSLTVFFFKRSSIRLTLSLSLSLSRFLYISFQTLFREAVEFF